jgi:hypothetical protein
VGGDVEVVVDLLACADGEGLSLEEHPSARSPAANSVTGMTAKHRIRVGLGLLAFGLNFCMLSL